jgi:hypothetical protein
VQVTIYYQEGDQYLIDKVEGKANRERKSKSAVILSIIETYFQANKKIGQILCDLDAASTDQVEAALEVQREEEPKEKLGRLLLERGEIREVDLNKALDIQSRAKNDIN